MSRILNAWVSAPPLKAGPMLIWAVVAVAAPTLLRASVDGSVQEAGFVPYLPFVLLSAVSLDWRLAAGVAIASGVLGDFLFAGGRYELLQTPTEIFGLLAFGVASALAISIARAFRKVVADHPIEALKGIVFSLEGGQAYVSWYGGRSFVPLGAEEEVARMMQDFLAQREVGRRLTRQK